MGDSHTDPDSSDEDVEPKLKYLRLANDLRRILNQDAISTVKVHTKYLCLGTHLGRIYLFDHLGNIVEERQDSFGQHMVSINQISVDAKGEYIAACSDEGRFTINGLYTTDCDQSVALPSPVRCLQLDPQFAKSGTGRRFITGDNKLTLYEKTFYKSLKSTVLCPSEGLVSALEWCDQYVAWASGLGVHVYNLVDKCSLGLIRWEDPVNAGLDEYRCNLRWANATTLLIGWVDTVRICVLRKAKDLAGTIVDPISTFRTDFFISGLAPLDKDELVVLGVPKERDAETGKPRRPQLSVLRYKSNDYVEICTDSLSMRGYQEYKINDYCLDLLPDENHFFVVSPKDVVVASLLENDDLVSWLIEHRRFEQAMQAIERHGGKYSMVSVARLYVDHLLVEQQYEDAARLCSRAFGSDTTLWEEEVYKFVKIQQLRSICPYLPQSMDCRLNPHVYEIVLYEFMKTDPQGFLKLVRDWDPRLYSASAVRNAVENHSGVSVEDKATLLEAVAILYTHEGNYSQAQKKYLRLQHRDAFQLIRRHNLYDILENSLLALLQLDARETIAILLEKRDVVTPECVVHELRDQAEYLLEYLDNLVRVEPVDSGKYHWRLLVLYAELRPVKLMGFLKRSHNYPINDAFKLCEGRKMYPEMVFLLDKMGNTHQAMRVIVREMGDVQKAIMYCKQINDNDLWNDLVKLSLENSVTITKLLDGIAGYIDPRILVREIKRGQVIPGLKQSLIKMMKDYSLQVQIEEKCNDILAADYFALHQRIATVQQRGVSISGSQRCGKCDEELFSAKEAAGATTQQPRRGVVYFNCHHIFHDTCLRSSASCIVCKP